MKLASVPRLTLGFDLDLHREPMRNCNSWQPSALPTPPCAASGVRNVHNPCAFVQTASAALEALMALQDMVSTQRGNLFVCLGDNEGGFRPPREQAPAVRKLSLVLDLDNTLLHTASHPGGAAFAQQRNTAVYDLQHRRQQLLTCLRPGLADFLTSMSSLYEMYVYTAGDRSYVEAVARLIDPDRSIFQNRLFSRDDVPGAGVMKDLTYIFSGDTSDVVIVDDRADIWTGWTANLVQIEPFHFFPGVGPVINGTPSASARVHGDCTDRPLRCVASILRWLHGAAFSTEKPQSIRWLLQKERTRHLRRMRLEFDPSCKDICRKLSERARKHGASIDSVAPTHVISRGKRRRKGSARIVHPKFLVSCLSHLYPIDESQYSMQDTGDYAPRRLQWHGNTT